MELDEQRSGFVECVERRDGIGGGRWRERTLSTGVNAVFFVQLISKLSAFEHTPRQLQPGQQFLMLPTTMPGERLVTTGARQAKQLFGGGGIG